MEPRRIKPQKCRFQLEQLEARVAPGVLIVGSATGGAGSGKIKFVEFTRGDAGQDGHGLSMAETLTTVVTWEPEPVT
jgi:hypothetical protein